MCLSHLVNINVNNVFAYSLTTVQTDIKGRSESVRESIFNISGPANVSDYRDKKNKF